jgi:hypothetical protein
LPFALGLYNGKKFKKLQNLVEKLDIDEVLKFNLRAVH